MEKTDINYVPGCPACEEAILLGLSFEETHSSHKLGYLETEDGYILSPHTRREGKYGNN